MVFVIIYGALLNYTFFECFFDQKCKSLQQNYVTQPTKDYIYTPTRKYIVIMVLEINTLVWLQEVFVQVHKLI